MGDKKSSPEGAAPAAGQWNKNTVWYYVTLASTVLFVWYTRSFFNSTDMRKMSLARLAERLLVPAFLWFLALSALRYILAQKVGPVLADAVFLRNHPVKGEERARRIHKLADHVYKLVYYSGASAFGYWAICDRPWFPTQLWGSGSLASVIDDESGGFTSLDKFDPWVVAYFQLSAGYHLQSLVFHAVRVGQYNYWEMLLHHVITIVLVVFSFMTLMVPTGAVVMLLHDASDSPTYLTKILSTSQVKGQIWDVVMFSSFLCMLFAWCWLRVYVFVRSVVYVAAAHTILRGRLATEIAIFTYMLCMLLVMHVFWISLFFKMGFSFLTTGDSTDTQEESASLHDKKAKKP